MWYSYNRLEVRYCKKEEEVGQYRGSFLFIDLENSNKDLRLFL